MKISIKSNDEIEKMRIAGKLAAEVLEMITPHVVPGISTGELDNMCYEHIINKQNAIPANVGYKGYEKTICSSLNQVICHGIPSNERILKDGDILSTTIEGLGEMENKCVWISNHSRADFLPDMFKGFLPKKEN